MSEPQTLGSEFSKSKINYLLFLFAAYFFMFFVYLGVRANQGQASLLSFYMFFGLPFVLLFIVDNFLHQMIRTPQDFDVVVLANEYGDILSDGAAALLGGLGLGPSSCIGKNYAYFEPIHGTAPDIAGKNIINPTATILSAAMMLEYLDMPEKAQQLQNAVYAVYAEGKHLTVDQGGHSSTTDFCKAVKARL